MNTKISVEKPYVCGMDTILSHLQAMIDEFKEKEPDFAITSVDIDVEWVEEDVR